MVFIVIRISGDDFALDDFLEGRNLEVDAVWRKGDVTPRGRVMEDYGFNLSLPDAESWGQALPSVHSFLRTGKELFRELLNQKVTMVLDIGVSVGEEKSFAPSLHFPHDFLTDLVSCGVELNVSAYPTSDET